MNIASVYNYDPFSLYLYRKGGSILKGRPGLLILVGDCAKTLGKLRKNGKSTKLTLMLRALISQYLASSENSEKELEKVIERFGTGKATEDEALVIKDLVENDIIKFNNIKKDELVSALENYTLTASMGTQIWDTAKNMIMRLPKWLKWTELISGGVMLAGKVLKPILKKAGSTLGSFAGDVVEGTIGGALNAEQGYNDARSNQNKDTQTPDTIAGKKIYNSVQANKVAEDDDFATSSSTW